MTWGHSLEDRPMQGFLRGCDKRTKEPSFVFFSCLYLLQQILPMCTTTSSLYSFPGTGWQGLNLGWGQGLKGVKVLFSGTLTFKPAFPTRPHWRDWCNQGCWWSGLWYRWESCVPLISNCLIRGLLTLSHCMIASFPLKTVHKMLYFLIHSLYISPKPSVLSSLSLIPWSFLDPVWRTTCWFR